ncbi:MAG: hypothetical protein QOF76_301, partial [Solirubrobacteraceae bacterium]|nr:hypothetical protein [Solirubrobacteraceae bacterium]
MISFVARRPYSPRMPIDERREQVLDSALAVLARGDYRGASMDAIAREAGVTRPVVYRAFEDLPALLTALLDRQEARALEQLGTAMMAPGTVIERLSGLIETVRADPGTWRAILLVRHSTPPAV